MPCGTLILSKQHSSSRNQLVLGFYKFIDPSLDTTCSFGFELLCVLGVTIEDVSATVETLYSQDVWSNTPTRTTKRHTQIHNNSHTTHSYANLQKHPQVTHTRLHLNTHTYKQV